MLRLSEQERREDALASRAEEGRDKLRKAMVRSKYPLTHGYPNEGTQLEQKSSYPYMSKVVYRKGTQGTETS